MITGGRYDDEWNPHATSELITLNENQSGAVSKYGPTLPVTVWAQCMLNIEGAIYLFGGFQNNVTSNHVWILDSLEGQWRKGPSMKYERRWTSCSQMKTTEGQVVIVVAGGPVNGDKVEILDVASGHWISG